jgi:hypothetical protein
VGPCRRGRRAGLFRALREARKGQLSPCLVRHRATAHPAGTSDARRVFEVASRRLCGRCERRVFAPSAILTSEFHVKHRHLAAIDSISLDREPNRGIGKALLHVKQPRLAGHSPRGDVRLTGALGWATHPRRRGHLPEVGPLTTADIVVLSARTMCASLAPPVAWCVSTTSAKRELRSSGRDRTGRPPLRSGDWSSPLAIPTLALRLRTGAPHRP